MGIRGGQEGVTCTLNYLAEQLSFKKEITKGASYERRNQGHQTQVFSPGIGRSTSSLSDLKLATRPSDVIEN